MSDQLIEEMKKAAGIERDYPVLAEIPIRSTDLHKIATGECCTMSKPGETLAIRFLLKSSFKAKNSNFVISNLVMQVVAVGKENAMRKEDIAVKTMVRTVTKEKLVKAKPSKEKIEVKVNDSQTEMF